MSTINGTSGNDVITGTAGDDIINGGLGNDRINGGAGNDVIYGGYGDDTLTGDAGNDQLYGDDGNDGMFGGGGDDLLFGGAGNDTMYGDGGNDTFYVGQGFDTVIGGTGNDTVVVSLSSSQLTPALRADLATLKTWLSDQATAAGSTTALNAQSSGPTLKLAALNLSISLVETVKFTVDGAARTLESLLNQAPTAPASATLTTQEDTPVHGSIGATDPDGDALHFTATQGPAHGTLTLDAATGAYTYAAAHDYSGQDQFVVQVADGNGGTTSQTVNIAVSGVADAPTLTTADETVKLAGSVLLGTKGGDTIVAAAGVTHILGGAGGDTITATAEGTVTAALDISAALKDADGSESLSITVSGVPGNATLSAGTVAADGSWHLTSADLNGLTITASTLADVNLHVVATATESDGDTAATTSDLSIVFDHSAAPSIVEGGSGNDVINGSAGSDLIYGNTAPSGTAKLPSAASEKDNDVIHGGDGNDTIYGQRGDDQLFGDNGNDYLSGGKGNDLLFGGAGANVVHGNSGDDTIYIQGGNDTVAGGSGFDTLDFSLATAGLAFDAGKGTAVGPSSTSFSGIEKIVGSAYSDTYLGSTHDDVFAGGDGNDVIRGGSGSDTLTGGAGDDTFVYMKKDAGALDHITDFSAGDRLDVHDFLKSAKYASIGDVVRVTDHAGEGSTVSVKVSGAFVDLVTLDNVHGLSAQDMLAHGMLLT